MFCVLGEHPADLTDSLVVSGPVTVCLAVVGTKYKRQDPSQDPFVVVSVCPADTENALGGVRRVLLLLFAASPPPLAGSNLRQGSLLIFLFFFLNQV